MPHEKFNVHSEHLAGSRVDLSHDTEPKINLRKYEASEIRLTIGGKIRNA